MTIETRQLAENVYQFRHHHIPCCPTNCFLIRGSAANFVIDTGFGLESFEAIQACINPLMPVMVINTHYHWDHIWGNCFFSDATFIASHRYNARVRKEWDRMLAENARFISGDIREQPCSMGIYEEIEFYPDGIQVFESPGHSPDGISVYHRPTGILFAGDNVGDDEAEVLPYLECSVAEFRKSLDLYKSLKPTGIASGHHDYADDSLLSRIEQRLEAQGS